MRAGVVGLDMLRHVCSSTDTAHITRTHSGRRLAALTYCVTYIIGCYTKHHNNYNILFLGRVFCGIATSLLYSAFESWVVAEHIKVPFSWWCTPTGLYICGSTIQSTICHTQSLQPIIHYNQSPTQRGFNSDWLGNLFSNAVFLGNGLMAIVSGLVAQYLAQFMGMGPVSPFDAAIVVLLVGAAIIAATWTENYGDNAGRQTLAQQFKHAAELIKDGMLLWLVLLCCFCS